MILTPICPRSLSFRSLVLPPHVTIRMKLSDKARGDALISADGKNIFQLSQGFTLEVRATIADSYF
jgi:NAD kinase